MPEDFAVDALVIRARAGDQGAWDRLVERYAPMLWSICRAYGLDRRDIDDVAQHVWMRAVEHLSRLRAPERLGSWLATTTKRECVRVRRARRRLDTAEYPLDAATTADDQGDDITRAVEEAERNAVLRAAFAELSPGCQRLLSLLMLEVSYTEISARLGMAVGSIGPTRSRCLARLRADAALSALMRRTWRCGKVIAMSEAWDDHELLARLRAAIEAAEAVPRDFVEAGKSAFAWREIDLDMELAELAELTYDSAMHREEEAAALRADSAVLRALTFAATQAHHRAGDHRGRPARPGGAAAGGGDPRAGRGRQRGAAGDRRPGRVRHPRQSRTGRSASTATPTRGWTCRRAGSRCRSCRPRRGGRHVIRPLPRGCQVSSAVEGHEQRAGQGGHLGGRAGAAAPEPVGGRR
ncbi:sigma-70 family RNA polymerase sigma factor [Nonomuraea rubra]|uniref:RNA polymerase sigma factor n=1 Tax=Nonomuraea rubra TaxID=46180 RepID=UPI0031EA8D0B